MHDISENQHSGPPQMQLMNNYKPNNENASYSCKKIEHNNVSIYQKSTPNQKFSVSKPVMIPQISHEDNLEEMSQKHEQLINMILADEEEVISLHRKHIDEMVETIKQVLHSFL